MNRIRTDVFKGLHKRDGAPEGAFLEVSGITTADHPSMKTRPPRARVGEWENATDVYETDGHLVVIDDNKLYYDGTFLSNVSNQKKQFAEINRKLVVWPDKIYINLNTGTLGALEAGVTGSVGRVSDTMIAIVDAAGTGHIDVETWTYRWWNAVEGHWETEQSEIYFRRYDNLVYDKDAGQDKWIVTNPRTVSGGPSGYFIGSKPESKGYRTDYEWYMGGSVYGRITSSEVIEVEESEGYAPGGDGKNYVDYYRSQKTRYYFELYDGEGASLNTMFEVGDVVNFEGSKLAYNNKENVELTGVDENRLSMDADKMIISNAVYYNVTEDLPEGMYNFVPEDNTNAYMYFKANRTIRAGEQIFMPSIGESVLERRVYTYDPAIQKLELQESGSNAEAVTLTANRYTTPEQGITIARKVPDMDYICERDNRLYGVSNSEEEKIFNTQTGQYETVTSRVLHASALGQPTRWNVFEGAATDSFAVAVAGEGDFTGIVSYSGSVIAFKEDRMYKLTGDYPAEFYLRSYSVDGVKKNCHKSLCIINEVLYYLSPYGVMSYSGGVPNLVSYELGIDRYEEAVAGRDRMNYLIQMDKLYCYDTIHGLWVSEDYGKVTGVESVGNRAYIVTDGKIMQTDSGDEEVEWYAMTHFTDEGTFLHKDYQAMNLDAALTEGAQMKIEYRLHEEDSWKTLDTMTSYHGTQWQNRKTLNEAKRMHHQFSPGIQRCDRIQFRLSGKGACKVYAYDRVVRFESDKP